MTRFRTPLGMPASRKISTMQTAVAGVSDAGLKTTVLPATSAGAIFQTGMATGKFHGVTQRDDAVRLLDGVGEIRRQFGLDRLAVQASRLARAEVRDVGRAL